MINYGEKTLTKEQTMEDIVSLSIDDLRKEYCDLKITNQRLAEKVEELSDNCNREAYHRELYQKLLKNLTTESCRKISDLQAELDKSEILIDSLQCDLEEFIQEKAN